MAEAAGQGIRDAVLAILSAHGVPSVDEREPLFSSGRLDSLVATEVLVLLETGYGVDLADENFDILQIDTLHDLEMLVSSRRADGAAAGTGR